MYDFAGKTVLITGATGGLGEAVTSAFIGTGATVAAVSRSVNNRPSVLGIRADVTEPEGASGVVEEVLGKTGRLDALVHLLGGFAGGRPVAETDDETWRHMIDLNLHAAFYMARAALPPMLARRAGRIVAVGSRTGVEPAVGLSAYGASKAGLVSLIRTIALEVNNAGVTANIVLPSVIDTPANRTASPSADFSKWVKPESIACLLLWLVSEQAGDVNGAVIPIYGRA
jgi:NAD(P)-dependent dehydrogenase (short-subunit alcohol dehydrogenase family)